jgi:hypothetical protein
MNTAPNPKSAFAALVLAYSLGLHPSVHWDGATTNFIFRTIYPPPSGSGAFEHSGFAPIDIPPLTQ